MLYYAFLLIQIENIPKSYKHLFNSLLITTARYQCDNLNDIVYLYHGTNIQYYETRIFLSIPGIGVP